jgi:hypothetical protein
MKIVELWHFIGYRNNHSNQPLDRLLQWSTTNEKLKAKTNAYRLWLQLNPNATKKEKSDKKSESFPSVTFAGTFTGTGKAEDINIMTGLFVVDFDHIENMEFVKMNLELDPFTYLLFISPSGDGLKVVIKHNLTNPDEWKYLYFEFETYYKNIHNIKTDKACKDISRMTFLPFIENLYRNDNSEVWQYKGKPYLPQKPERTHIAAPNENSEDLYKECFYLSAYLFENKIDLTESYNDWILYGYSLSAIGEQGREIFNNISCLNPEYDPDETNKQFTYQLKHFDPNKTGIDFFISNAKTAIVEQLLQNKYGFTAET